MILVIVAEIRIAKPELYRDWNFSVRLYLYMTVLSFFLLVELECFSKNRQNLISL